MGWVYVYVYLRVSWQLEVGWFVYGFCARRYGKTVGEFNWGTGQVVQVG